MPVPLPGPYRSPYANSISELLARQGDIAARGAERQGQIWGGTVQQLGQIGAQAYQAHQEDKQQKALSLETARFIDSGAWRDPEVALKWSMKTYGPQRGLAMYEGLHSAAKLEGGNLKPEEAMKALPGLVRAIAAAPADLRPGMYNAARGLTVKAGIMGEQDLPPEWDDKLLGPLTAWADSISPLKAPEMKVVGAGDTVIGADGKPIYQAAPKPEKTLADIEAEAEARARGTRSGNPPKPEGPAPALTPTQEANVINRLTTQWAKASETTRELSRQAKLMDTGLAAARRGDLAAGSQAVLVTFQKILDPTSVVRESEYARSAAGQALLAQIEGWAEKLQKGGAGVPLSELEKYAKVAHEMVGAGEGYMKAQKERIARVADRYKIPRDVVFEDYDYSAGSGKVAPGKVGRFTVEVEK